MRITVNGKIDEIGSSTLQQYLSDCAFHLERIAVERNGSIAAREEWGDIVLEDGDHLEIVSFVPGG